MFSNYILKLRCVFIFIMADTMQSNQEKINVSDYKSLMQSKTSHKDLARACNEHPVKSRLFLRAPNSVYVF